MEGYCPLEHKFWFSTSLNHWFMVIIVLGVICICLLSMFDLFISMLLPVAAISVWMHYSSSGQCLQTTDGCGQTDI